MFEFIYEYIHISPLIQQVAVAIAIGGLIGIEREKKDKYAGLRTLALLCGAAPIMVHGANMAGHDWLIVIYLILAATLAISTAYVRFTIEGRDIGFTTMVAIFIVALLGILVGYGQILEATSIGIVVAFILAEKRRMLRYVDRLTYRELSDSMKLGALVFILYPILPSEPIDPYNAINLREVLVFVIVVLLIEFSSYVSMRQLGGSKGLQVTGLLAGGANSFATAGVMARMANQSEAALNPASSALLIATVSMIVRNITLASIVAISIFWIIWLPGVVMIGLALLFALALWHRGETPDEFEIDLDSPFSFKSAVKFAIIYVGIMITTVLAQEFFGETGLYATAFIGGLVSSAAVALSAGSVANTGVIGLEAAAGMVIIGIAASLTSKIILIELINRHMRNRVAVPMGVVGVVGIAVYLFI